MNKMKVVSRLATVLVLAAVLVLASAVSAAAGPVVLQGATIHPVSGPDVAHGTLVIDGGKIVAVGADVAVPEGALDG